METAAALAGTHTLFSAPGLPAFGTMTEEVAELKAQLNRMEQKVRELTARIELLERYTAPRAEHPSDEAAIRRKVSYDWQS
jgi:cell division protein FtsB